MLPWTLLFVLLVVYTLIKHKTLRIQSKSLTKQDTQVLQCLMAIGIIIGHCLQLSSITDTHIINTFFLSLFSRLGWIGVGAFLFISGYGLTYSLSKNGKDYTKHLLLKKFKRIGKPFIISFIIWQAYCIITMECNKYYNYSLIEQVLSGNCAPILPYSWYVFLALCLYFYFQALFHAYPSLIRKKFVLSIVMIVSSTLFCIVLSYYLRFQHYWYIVLPLFFIGILFQSIESYINKINPLYMCLFFIITGFLSKGTNTIYQMMLFSTSLSLFCIFAAKTIDFKPNKVWSFLGPITYEMYIVQAIPIYLLKAITNYSALLYIIVVILVDIALAYTIHKICNTRQ